MIQDILSNIEWHVIARQYAFGLLVFGIGLMYGKLTPAPDESKMRDWIVYVRHDSLAQGLMAGLIIAGSGITLDYWIYHVVIPRFQLHPIAGVGIIVLGLIFGGVGFPIGKWLAFNEYNPVSKPK